jgi:hypothetical protein
MGIRRLKGNWLGETAWVVGSGRTLEHVEPWFFHGKRTIAVNHSAQYRGFVPNILFSHYHSIIREALQPQTIGVTLRFDTVTREPLHPKPGNALVYDSPYEDPAGPNWNPYDKPPAADGLLYGSSSIHGAMHLAAYMGASFIMLVGADCGWLDGEDRIEGYPKGENPPEAVLGIFEQHNRLVKRWLKEQYDVDVYSLNPFLNLNLEGHSFKGAL